MFGVRAYNDFAISGNVFLRFTAASGVSGAESVGESGDILLNANSHIFSIESKGSGSAITVLIPSAAGYSTCTYSVSESPKQVHDKLQAFEAHQDALMKAAHANDELIQPHLPIPRGISQGAMRRAKMRVRGQDVDTADYDSVEPEPAAAPVWDPFI